MTYSLLTNCHFRIPINLQYYVHVLSPGDGTMAQAICHFNVIYLPGELRS